MARVTGRLTTSPDLLIDRHYRGAIVMVGAKMFAVDESAIRLVERVQRGALGERTAADDEKLAELIERGVLRADAEDA